MYAKRLLFCAKDALGILLLLLFFAMEGSNGQRQHIPGTWFE
jgi:hypothetical protein